MWQKIKEFIKDCWQKTEEAAIWTVDWVNGDTD